MRYDRVSLNSRPRKPLIYKKATKHALNDFVNLLHTRLNLQPRLVLYDRLALDEGTELVIKPDISWILSRSTAARERAKHVGSGYLLSLGWGNALPHELDTQFEGKLDRPNQSRRITRSM